MSGPWREDPDVSLMVANKGEIAWKYSCVCGGGAMLTSISVSIIHVTGVDCRE